MEADSKATIKNNFRMNLFFINQNLKNNNKKIATYILMGVLFLLTAYLIPESKDLSLLISLLMEGLFVGGWVFLWEAFSIFFFGSRELKDKKKRYFRYLESEIFFKYTD
jgi:predicted membrane channel-forming protein YqfA (hemolysin III family)